MKRVKCTAEAKGLKMTIVGTVTNEIYDSHHELIGYEIEYEKDKHYICSFKNFKVEEL